MDPAPTPGSHRAVVEGRRHPEPRRHGDPVAGRSSSMRRRPRRCRAGGRPERRRRASGSGTGARHGPETRLCRGAPPARVDACPIAVGRCLIPPSHPVTTSSGVGGWAERSLGGRPGPGVVLSVAGLERSGRRAGPPGPGRPRSECPGRRPSCRPPRRRPRRPPPRGSQLRRGRRDARIGRWGRSARDRRPARRRIRRAPSPKRRQQTSPGRPAGAGGPRRHWSSTVSAPAMWRPGADSPAGITPAPAMGGPYRGGHRGEGGAVKAGVLVRRSSTASEAPDGGGEAICPARSARRGGMRPGPSGGVLRPPDAPGARRRPSVRGPGPVGHGCAENGGTAGARLDGAAGRTALRAAVPAGLPRMGLPGGGGPRPPSSPVARSSARRAPAALASEREATTARPTRHRSPS